MYAWEPLAYAVRQTKVGDDFFVFGVLPKHKSPKAVALYIEATLRTPAEQLK